MAPKRLLPWIDLEKINGQMLSMNPAAIELLAANPEKINWAYLSENPSALELLKANQERIKLDWIARNPSIFEEIPEPPFKQELIEKVFHPKRVIRFGGPEWLECV
jgi:hypothetical protein